MGWRTTYTCTGCDGGTTRHLHRHSARGLLVLTQRAAAKGYPVVHRCGGELLDVTVRRRSRAPSIRS